MNRERSELRLQTSETQDELDRVFADSKAGVVRPDDGSQLPMQEPYAWIME